MRYIFSLIIAFLSIPSYGCINEKNIKGYIVDPSAIPREIIIYAGDKSNILLKEEIIHAEEDTLLNLVDVDFDGKRELILETDTGKNASYNLYKIGCNDIYEHKVVPALNFFELDNNKKLLYHYTKKDYSSIKETYCINDQIFSLCEEQIWTSDDNEIKRKINDDVARFCSGASRLICGKNSQGSIRSLDITPSDNKAFSYNINYKTANDDKMQLFTLSFIYNKKEMNVNYDMNVFIGMSDDELCVESLKEHKQIEHNISCYLYHERLNDWISLIDMFGTYDQKDRGMITTLYDSFQYQFSSGANIGLKANKNYPSIKKLFPEKQTYQSFLKKKLREKKEVNIHSVNLVRLLHFFPVSASNVRQYNDLAYYLEQASAYKQSVYLLDKIITKYPNRTVAYINLGDAHLGNKNQEKAYQSYQTYIRLMKESTKEARIPKRVLDYITQYKTNR